MKHYYYHGSRRRRVTVHSLLIVIAIFTGLGLLILTLKSVDPPEPPRLLPNIKEDSSSSSSGGTVIARNIGGGGGGGAKSCATVEEMGKSLKGDRVWKENLRVRNIIADHFNSNGASRVRDLPAEQFCRHGFVLAKASEAGLGNEMYKILTAAALSVMLNRSLIIGQTRHIIGSFSLKPYLPFLSAVKIITNGLYFSVAIVVLLYFYSSGNYQRHLVMRIDDFGKPVKTNVLCSNWRKWDQPIIWFQNTTDAVASQFFLKNVHPEMRNVASNLFGQPEKLQARPNVFGELMRILISPSENIEQVVNWVLDDGVDPDISLHMRMLMNRSVRAPQAALNCIRRALRKLRQISRPRVVLVTDTPSFAKSILPNISEFAEVIHFDYKHFQGNISRAVNSSRSLDFRVKDWGPAPRWVAFVDFFLASRAKHAVVAGAHRRVGTTYAQLIAALAAANHLGENSNGSSFSFLSSFQSNLLADGLRLQVGWGHVWNRFAGPLSCKNQPNQCAFTPLLPPAWWDGLWQSPIPRDVRRLEAFGIKLSGFGTIDEKYLQSFCSSKKNTVNTALIL
ncbi:hypothetical protein SADUNF_Sadunf16G0203300 [Salix dunnii]|uniref:Uncharacterized protein n=1 Tax=Salix dunnii TaxID=1413687 RepID=A0A835MMA8_9ROSI|nr:hypothetical protein SADUNF_Sadunf16G0203300 [Salix dunnii]